VIVGHVRVDFHSYLIISGGVATDFELCFKHCLGFSSVLCNFRHCVQLSWHSAIGVAIATKLFLALDDVKPFSHVEFFFKLFKSLWKGFFKPLRDRWFRATLVMDWQDNFYFGVTVVFFESWVSTIVVVTL
jgi:hypothetical protein